MNDEKTIFDGENTQYQSHDEEATQYDDAYNNENTKTEETETSDNKDNAAKGEKPIWKKVAVGAGSGIFLGSAATLLSASAPLGHAEGENAEEEGSETHPEWTDGEVSVASSVSDDMSFSEAFTAARNEVGSGGVFEWHGNIYSTFTEDEWNGMTAEQRDEYGSHFSWHSDNSSTETASSTHSSTSSHSEHATDEVEVVTTDNNGQASQNHGAIHDEVEVSEVTQTSHTEEVAVVDVDPEVEVLGVVHDEESGANIAGLAVDGQEVVLIDVNGDETFDVMGADVNGDQQLTQNEMVDISGQNITVNDLGGISNPDGSLYASNNSNEIDYTNDTAVYDA